MILHNIIQGTTLSRRALYSSSYDRCCSLAIQTILNNNNCLSTISTSSIESFYSRYFHSTPAAHANKKRRVSASSARKKKQQQLTKQHNLKAKKKKKQQQSTTTTYALTVGSIPDPISKQQKANRQVRDVPRSFLVQTASKYAYIAKCAVFNEQTGEMYVDPKSLFSELNSNTSTTNNYKQKKNDKSSSRKQLPRIFRNSHLEYFPPSSFPNFEPPNYGTPEVAFLGRSNVGKSSLINALSSMIQRGGTTTGTTGASGDGELAKTSKRPGRTQTINYFGLLSNNEVKKEQNNPNLCKLFLVDLPGFGYAAAPDESVDEWQRKTQEFLITRASTQDDTSSGSIRPWPDSNNDNLNKLNKHQQRRINQHNSPSPPLKRLYLLLDSRLPDPPLLDISVMGWCDEYSIPYTIVLTKVDGSSKATCVRLANQLCMRYHSLYMGTTTNHDNEEVYMDPVIYLTTSKDGVGMEELLLSVENNMFSMVENDEDRQLDENVDGE